MESNKRYRPYEERYLFFSSSMEKLILRIFFLFFIILITLQILLPFTPFRNFFVPVEKLEGAFGYLHLLN